MVAIWKVVELIAIARGRRSGGTKAGRSAQLAGAANARVAPRKTSTP